MMGTNGPMLLCNSRKNTVQKLTGIYWCLGSAMQSKLHTKSALTMFKEITTENYEAAKSLLVDMVEVGVFGPEFHAISKRVCEYEAENDLQYNE